MVLINTYILQITDKKGPGTFVTFCYIKHVFYTFDVQEEIMEFTQYVGAFAYFLDSSSENFFKNSSQVSRARISYSIDIVQ